MSTEPPVTRVDRLLQLFENGSTSTAVRLMAGKQISSYVEKLFQIDDSAHENATILKVLLASKIWEVRTAAKDTLKDIVFHLHKNSQLSSSPLPSIENENEKSLKILKDFDLENIIENYDPLVASAGNEFDVDLSTIDAAARLAHQKQQIKKTLAMDGLDEMPNDLIEDKDLQETTHLEDDSESNETPKELSPREKAMQRRKNFGKKQSSSSSAENKSQVNKPSFVLEENDILMKLSNSDYCLRSLLALRSNLLNSNWTVRHGALLGVTSLMDPSLDISCYVLCLLAREIIVVLALDRFSDFVGDQTIAPVRETASQALTSIYSILPEQSPLRPHLVNLMLYMTQSDLGWQVRHSGLLCIKYFTAIDSHLLSERSAEISKTCSDSFEDSDDDIRAISLEIIQRILVVGMYPNSTGLFNRIIDILMQPDEDLDQKGASSAVILNSFDILAFCKDQFKTKDHVWCLCQYIRNSNSQVRERVIGLLAQLDLNQLFPNETDRYLLLRILCQCIYLEDSLSLKRKLYSLIETINLTLHPSLLPVFVALCKITLSGPANQPMDPSNFVFIENTSEVGPKLSSTPAAHEIGFKHSDFMIRTEDEVIDSKRLVSRILFKISSLYDENVNLKISNALVKKNDACSVASCLWIFKSIPPPAFPSDLSDLWKYRLDLAVYLRDENISVDQSLLADYIKTETSSECLQDCSLIITRCESIKSILKLLGSNSQMKKKVKSILVVACVDKKLMDVYGNGEYRMEALYIDTLTRNVTLTCALDHVTDSFSNIIHEFVVDIISIVIEREIKLAIDFLMESIIPRIKKGESKSQLIDILNGLFDINYSKLAEYASLFLIPILGKIADSDEKIRLLASTLFAKLLALVPLSSSSLLGSFESNTVKVAWEEAQDFMAQFMGDSIDDLRHGGGNRSKSIPEYPILVPIKAELREYQRSGIAWMRFLARYGLHGALCDDMGLGKTLQTIVTIATSHFDEKPSTPSLIICPSSLVGHWEHEIKNYATSLGQPLVFSGTIKERRNMWRKWKDNEVNTRVMIMSYDTARNDVEQLGEMNWHYLVLDEGHAIKNPKAKLTLAIKTLKADHRLILSGTPIQNNVIELWSLFDFLMPGMLGSESEFMERYGKGIMSVQPQINSDGTVPKGSGGVEEFKEAERKLQSLHRQVLPFLLRRMKEDVLKDLPPKIIQDLECDPSPLQRYLYEDMFGESGLDKDELLEENSDTITKSKPHVFKALQYLRKICVHPALVLSYGQKEQLEQLEEKFGKMDIKDLSIGPKFALLKELLEECGFGEDGEVKDPNRHRVLIFAQQKGTLDLIERILFQTHFPSMKYLRMDGSVDQRVRFEMAQKFNKDTSIDVMLLTTPVGGLGLNLTGADTVIFVEHDWNPMKDLQAMDRAHRLGQKKVVTVYRLIVRETLEQQILGLQSWKRKVAATIVQQQDLTSKDGKRLQSTNLLDLLSSNDIKEPDMKRAKGKSSSEVSVKTQKWLEKHGVDLEDTDDNINNDSNTNEYAQSFDVDGFVRSITK